MSQKLFVGIDDIQKAQQTISSVIRKTAIDKSQSLSKILDANVYLKFENQQITGSFKLRGAFNKISNLNSLEKKAGVVACSAGNHAQGVAYSAKAAKVASKIIMPRSAPIVKIEATKEYGGEVILHGEIFDEALEEARRVEKDEKKTFVHPYEDNFIVAGQGTVGLEILSDIPQIDTLVVPIGGGGLISGIAIAVKAINPSIKVIGVQSIKAPGMNNLFHRNELQKIQKISTIADGIAIKRPSQNMYDSFISKFVDDIVTVTDDEIAEAIVLLLEKSKTMTEGSGAVSVAALMNKKLSLGSNICAILSGGNIDLNIVSKVIEKGQIRKGRLVELSVIVDDAPGSLNKLTQAIAELGVNVLEVHHDRVSGGLNLRETRIDFVIETKDQEQITNVKKALEKTGARII